MIQILHRKWSTRVAGAENLRSIMAGVSISRYLETQVASPIINHHNDSLMFVSLFFDIANLEMRL